MYRIERPSGYVLRKQLPQLKKKIEEQIDRFLSNDDKINRVKVVHNSNFVLYAKVESHSITEWFLKWLKDGNNLEQLLIGDMSHLLKVVDMVERERILRNVDDKIVYEKISQTKYEEIFTKEEYSVPIEKDLFNEIVSEIFIENGYNGKYKENGIEKIVFDKTEHINSLNLRICPYCGRSFIYAIEEGTDIIKPQIDHFLPKRKYPYLALSFFNMIPVCQTCNMISCKGEFDPMMNIGSRPFLINYPYEFDDKLFTFKTKVIGTNYYQGNNYEVTIEYNATKELAKASKEVMKLDGFYHYHNHEVGNIYRQFMVLSSRAKRYYEQFKLAKFAFTPSSLLLFGYEFNEENSKKELLYKLKKETYEQMEKLFMEDTDNENTK